MSDWIGWIGLDLSQNFTPPRAPCGANNQLHLAQCLSLQQQQCNGEQFSGGKSSWQAWSCPPIAWLPA